MDATSRRRRVFFALFFPKQKPRKNTKTPKTGSANGSKNAGENETERKGDDGKLELGGLV
jgi:hypothetical protein